MYENVPKTLVLRRVSNSTPSMIVDTFLEDAREIIFVVSFLAPLVMICRFRMYGNFTKIIVYH